MVRPFNEGSYFMRPVPVYACHLSWADIWVGYMYMQAFIMCLPLIYICGAVIWCSSAHHPFVQIHNNRGVDLGKGNAEDLFTCSENSVHLYDGLFLFPVATKRLPHTLQRCWTL